MGPQNSDAPRATHHAPFRLVALDLDGTLFGDDLVIRPAVRAAIAAVLARGVRVTLATGRMFRSTLPYAEALGITTPLICYQGAQIRDPADGAILFERPLAHDLALAIIAVLNEQGLYPNLYLNDNLYVAEVNPGTAFYAKLNGGIRIHPVGDLGAFLRASGGNPTKLSVVLGTPLRAEAVVALLGARFGDQVYATQSHPIFAEAVNPTCDKGVALAALADHLGIAQAETLAIGDGSNDVPLLRWAGVGVAMGQAPAAVRAAADYVAPALADDGVAAALHRFILNPQLRMAP